MQLRCIVVFFYYHLIFSLAVQPDENICIAFSSKQMISPIWGNDPAQLAAKKPNNLQDETCRTHPACVYFRQD